MLGALLLGAFVETVGMDGRPVACTFHGRNETEAPIEVVLTPRPSLKDVPGLYRVEMAVNGTFKLAASAQPIVATDTNDVIVSAKHGGDTRYTIGFDESGNAALNILITDDGPNRDATWVGHCRNHERVIHRWSMF